MSTLVTITPAQLSFAVHDGETVLQAALRNNIDFPHRCRQGVCSSCVCKLTGGQVRYNDPQPLAELDKQQQFTYCCLAYPITDLVLHHPFIRG